MNIIIIIIAIEKCEICISIFFPLFHFLSRNRVIIVELLYIFISPTSWRYDFVSSNACKRSDACFFITDCKELSSSRRIIRYVMRLRLRREARDWQMQRSLPAIFFPFYKSRESCESYCRGRLYSRKEAPQREV